VTFDIYILKNFNRFN